MYDKSNKEIIKNKILVSKILREADCSKSFSDFRKYVRNALKRKTSTYFIGRENMYRSNSFS
jgi:hypothetical protein